MNPEAKCILLNCFDFRDCLDSKSVFDYLIKKGVTPAVPEEEFDQTLIQELNGPQQPTSSDSDSDSDSQSEIEEEAETEKLIENPIIGEEDSLEMDFNEEK